MTLKEVEAELRFIAEQMKPLMKRSSELNRERRRLKSIAFIEANGVRREDVEMSSSDDKPWFGNIMQFGEWLKSNSNKRFCEWNEMIYFTVEVVNGRMDPDAAGTIRELTN